MFSKDKANMEISYIGEIVYHKVYGRGVIVSQIQRYITVRFETGNEEKRFQTPDCFSSFLRFEDETLNNIVVAELNTKRDSEELQKQTKKQKTVERIQNRQSGRTSRFEPKVISTPIYDSVEMFCSEQKRLILNEINYLKSGKGKKIKIFEGKLVDEDADRFIYSFEAETELFLPDNTMIDMWLPGREQSIQGSVIDNEEFTVIITSPINLGDSVPFLEFTAQTWMLHSYLIERLNELQQSPSSIVNSLVTEGRKNIDSIGELKKGQGMAIQLSNNRPITFIWGPPGTGKTETLAEIAQKHIGMGRKVLMLSYSNVSVDGAIWRVFRKDENPQPGRYIRYGYPRDKELLDHEYLTSYNLCILNHRDLIKKREDLIIRRKTLKRTDPEYIEVGQKLKRIREKLIEEEKRSVSGASFVATTVSKAIVDKTIYSSMFDTVIFDEASMAYIPQIVFAASLAKRHFVCMGDFSQLPPIVQSDPNSALNVDIFKYCGIVDAVNSGCAHNWLCMLDVQYRMHPNIADFVSNKMYHNLLKSAEGMAHKRKDVVAGEPFAGNPMSLVDLSGMMSVCSKTSDGSRINLLSAIISMQLAIKAAQVGDVAVITPYNAQSRLLHAMARDAQGAVPEMKKIACATVHQFQGSERDTVIFDAVDCYRMPYPGTLLTSMTNDYANRLYNVALTRARGKIITVANVSYMNNKNLSSKLVLQKMFSVMKQQNRVFKGVQIISAADGDIKEQSGISYEDELYLRDIETARKEVLIDIPGGCSGEDKWFDALASDLKGLIQGGIKVTVRTDQLSKLPGALRAFAIINPYITDPVTIIDRSLVWYGMPGSTASFVTEQQVIATDCKPIFRLEGKNFARVLYGFLEMSDTTDRSDRKISPDSNETYNTFMAYVAGEITCPQCGAPMRLRKNKSGKYYLGCSNYPRCSKIQYITADMVNDYFYFNNPHGKRCPRDNTSLEAKNGPYGMYICCNGLKQHKYKLDEV